MFDLVELAVEATHVTQNAADFWFFKLKQPHCKLNTEKCLRCNDGITGVIHILSHFARAKVHFTMHICVYSDYKNAQR